MNKRSAVSAVAERCGCTKKSAAKVIDTLFEVISESVENGEGVSFVGFGSFYPKKLAKRTIAGIDGAEHIVGGETKLAFRASEQQRYRSGGDNRGS